MGKKIVGLYCFLCILSFVLMSVSCFNKWHQVTFKTMAVKTAFRLETSLTRCVMPKNSRLFCRTFTKRQPKRCMGPTDGWPLQEAAADWCASAITTFYQHPCIAFNRAYLFGMIVLITYALNVILLSSSAYLLYYYLDSKDHKPIYRTWALILHGIGAFLMICAVTGYTLFVIPSLDHIGGQGIVLLLEASQSVGISPGYFLVWVSILLQIIAMFMHSCMRLSNEQTEEQRIYKAMLKEQETYGAMEEQAASFQGGEAYAGYDAAAAGGAYGGYDAAAAGGGYDASYAGGYDPGMQYAGFPQAPGAYAGAPMAPQPAGMPQGSPAPQPGQPGQAAW